LEKRNLKNLPPNVRPKTAELMVTVLANMTVEVHNEHVTVAARIPESTFDGLADLLRRSTPSGSNSSGASRPATE
jgi:hypothetical protein